MDRYRKLLSEVDSGQLSLLNDNFDTGDVTGPGKYQLNDKAQARLLDELTKQNFNGASPGIRAELLEFFGHPDAPYAVKRKPKDWARIQKELEQLKNATPPAAATIADDPSVAVPSSE